MLCILHVGSSVSNAETFSIEFWSVYNRIIFTEQSSSSCQLYHCYMMDWVPTYHSTDHIYIVSETLNLKTNFLCAQVLSGQNKCDYTHLKTMEYWYFNLRNLCDLAISWNSIVWYDRDSIYITTIHVREKNERWSLTFWPKTNKIPYFCFYLAALF